MSKKNLKRNSSKDQSDQFKQQISIKNIKANRDVIIGDQSNTHYYSVESITLEQFVSEIQKCKKEIDRLKNQSQIDPETAKMVGAAGNKIDETIAEIEKKEPLAETINSALRSAKEIMDKIEDNISTSFKLGTSLGNLALIALKVFGKI